MGADVPLLFDQHPDPMWIFDRDTLRFLAVNAAALRVYGYARDEFLTLTLNDIRPTEDTPLLAADLEHVQDKPTVSGPWVHRTKNGRLFLVEIWASAFEHEGRPARLIRAADVTALKTYEFDARLREARDSLTIPQTAASGSYIQAVVCSLQASVVALCPKTLGIVAASEAFAALVGTPVDGLLGRPILELFPQPGADKASGAAVGLEESLAHVRQTGFAHAMGIQRYPVRAPADGSLSERHWLAVNTPVMTPDGVLRFILHRTDDVTAHVAPAVAGIETEAQPLPAAERATQLEIDLLLKSLELGQAQEKLLERERLLEGSERAGRLGSWTLNLNEDVLHWSENVFRIFGLEPRPRRLMNSADFMELVHQDDREALLEARRQVLAGKGDLNIIHRIIRPDGVVRTVHENAELIREGETVRLIGTVRDITDTIAQQEHLRLLETALHRLNDIVLITEGEPFGEPGPSIVYVNDAFERRTGFSREEALGKTPRILQGPKTQKAELKKIRQALENWQPVRAELINYTKAGEEFWLELDIVPVANEDGWYTHWVAVERDITERKQAQAALSATAERLTLLARATSDVIWDWDLRADVIIWNEGLRNDLGYDFAGDTTPGRFRPDHTHPEDQIRVAEVLSNAIDGREDTWEVEYRVRRADGAYLNVIERGFVIRDEDKKAARMVGSMLDVTQQRQLESQLRQSQRLDAIGQLTGGVAHDFNNLLTVILGNAELLVEGLEGNARLQSLARLTEAAAVRGSDLTGRLLAFARRQPLEPKPTDINQLLSGMDPLFRRTLGEHIQMEFVRAGGLWQADVDGSQLENAVLNLCINARDAMPDGGTLTVETANAFLDDSYVQEQGDLVPGQYVCISVSDTGTGMTPEVIRQAFDPFFTTKPVGKGSGLGLSMVYGFAKQSQGHVRIYSELGVGTTVRLYLPRSKAAVRLQEEANTAAYAPVGSETVLVVEDDDLVRSHVSSLLEGLGYQVLTAADGPTALMLLRERSSIDLLFTDIVMPGGINGRELAEIGRMLRPGMRVLFTSGYTENAIVHHGRLDAGVHLLNKPYRRIDLAKKIRTVMASPLP